MKQTVFKQLGIGLIEVLVALLVVALGLLSLASFQGDLMQSSSDSKAQAEAIALAEQKIEVLRSSVEIENDGDTGYTDLPALLEAGNTHTDAIITGQNAVFTRTWEVTDVASYTADGTPERKEISVKVAWVGADGENKAAYATTEMAWMSPAKSLLTSEDSVGTGSVPSPRQNASEDVASEKLSGGTSATYSGTAGTDSTLTVLGIDDGVGSTTNLTVTQIAPGSHYYAIDDDTAWHFIDPGVIGVFLCANTFCTYIQNHFGGVVHRVTGRVFSTSGLGLGDIKVAWSSSQVNVCYTSTSNTDGPDGTSGTSDDMDTMVYECIYAGNCDAEGGARGGLGVFGGNGCSTYVSDAEIAGRNVGPGGEFGDLGLLGVDDQGGNQEQLCFLEDTSDWSDSNNALLYGAASGEAGDESYILPVTKRFYVARRMNSDGTQASEGINVSFINHNFLIVDRATGLSTKKSCYEEVVSVANNDEELAPREIVRVLSANNTVDTDVAAEEDYDGATEAAQVVTGTITSASAKLRLYVSTPTYEGSCYIKNDSSAYACAIPSDATNVTISGGSTSSTVYSECVALSAGVSALCNWPDNFSP